MPFVAHAGTSTGATAATSIAVTLNGVTAGNLLWVAVGYESSSASVTIADGGNTWQAGPTLSNAGDPYQVRLFYAENVAGGNRTVTATFGASVDYRAIYVQERSGLSTSGAYEGGSSLRQTTGTTRNAGTYSNTGAGELVAIGMDFFTNSTPTVGSGFTARAAQWQFGLAGNFMLPEDAAYATAGSRSATFGMNTSTISYCLQMFLLEAGETEPTIYTETLSSALSLDDSTIQQIISSLVLSRILDSTLSVDDEIRTFLRRNRQLDSAISITEGDLVRSSVVNMDAADSLSISDEQALFLLRRRLAGDDIGISDEVLAQTTGIIIYQRILDSLTTITDESMAFAYLRRLRDSEISVADQVDRFTLVTRVLLDALSLDDDLDASLVLDQIIARILTSDIGLFDEPMSAMQRFILLSEMLSVQDDATAAFIPHVGGLFVPRIVIGFDQPRIELGGYRI